MFFIRKHQWFPLPWWERVRVRGISLLIAVTLPFIPSRQGRGTIGEAIHFFPSSGDILLYLHIVNKFVIYALYIFNIFD
jgi:hypothetical protein